MKLNPEFAIFDENAFVQARQALADLSPADNLDDIILTIGEPQMPAPALIAETLDKQLKEGGGHWQYYPKHVGNPAFLTAVHSYIERRFGQAAAGLVSPGKHIFPVPGTREPLHLLGACMAGVKDEAIALVSNPFYHAWRAGALASGGAIHYLNAVADNGFLPDLDAVPDDIWVRASIIYLCAPTNPQGGLASKNWLEKALKKARAHQVLLVMDECYADIWRQDKPIGMLEVAAELAQSDTFEGDPLQNLVIIHSLSKRSGAAGLRVGFICGDPDVVSAYAKLAANGAALIPTPLLDIASALYQDDVHNADIRAHYDKNFAILEQALAPILPDLESPKGGFFLWLAVGDDIGFSRALYAKTGLRVMPGRYMAAEGRIDGTQSGQLDNPGTGYVRIALVHDHEKTAEIATRLAHFLAEYGTEASLPLPDQTQANTAQKVG